MTYGTADELCYNKAMRTLLISLVAIAVLWLTPAAYADTWFAVYQDGSVASNDPAWTATPIDQVLPADLLAAARQPWDSPCAGREAIYVVTGALYNSPPEYPARVNSAGVAIAGACLIVIRDDILQDPLARCLVVSHELGHLAGYGHSDDPHDVMYGGGLETLSVTHGACRAYARSIAPANALSAPKAHRKKAKPRKHRRASKRHRLML